MRRLLAAVASAISIGAIPSVALAQKLPADIRSDLKGSISRVVDACSAAAGVQSAFGSSVRDLIRGFDRLTNNQSSCRWAGQVGSAIEVAQLAGAAKEIAEELAKSGEGYEKEFAARIAERANELIEFARVGGDQPVNDRYQYQTNTKTLGMREEAIDPLRVSLQADTGRFGGPWNGRFPSDLGNVLDLLNATADQTCSECTARAKRLIRYIPVFAAIDTATLPIAQQDWSKLRDVAARNEARWDAYHFGAGWDRVQLPWELAINGLIYKSLIKKRPEEREGDLPGAPVGPPEWALVVGHPSVGIAPFDDEGADSGLIGIVEAVGVSWWDYDDTTNKRKNEFGLSLAAVYQEREIGNDWSPGLLVRLPYNGISVVWSRVDGGAGDDEDVFAFSIDPTSLFKGDSVACLFGLPGCGS